MYQYKKAIVKQRVTGRYVEEDVSNQSIKLIQQNHSEVFLILTHSISPGVWTVRLTDLYPLLVAVGPEVSVAEWLVTNGSSTLPGETGEYEIVYSDVLCRDSWQAGYKATTAVASGSPLNEAPESEKPDIWLSREDTTYTELRDHVLVTVNGLLHRCDADDKGLYIKEGAVTARKAGNAFIGLLSFASIGRVSTHTIEDDMVYNPDPTKRLSDSLVIRSPVDLTNKFVGVVIAGILHWVGRDVIVTGPNTIRVNTKHLPLIERYMEFRHLMDLSVLKRHFEVFEGNDVDYDLAQMLSNECMLDMMGMSQSFIVTVDCDNLETIHHSVSPAFIPGRFYHDERPLWPLVLQYGLMPSYISVEESGTWVIRCDKHLYNRRQFANHSLSNRTKVSAMRETEQVQRFANACLVQYRSSKIRKVN